MIKKGTWIEVQRTILQPEERSPHIPEDTKKTPLVMWIKGFCQEDCHMGDWVKVETIIGRIEEGEVVDAAPKYTHGFGEYVSEISYIGRQAKEILRGEK